MSAPEAVAPATGGFWRRRVVTPLLNQLRQGITPHEIALTLALGGVIGILPVIGATTALCGLVGVWLRLNQPVIQLVNYLVYPLQILLLIPFLRAGEWLYQAEPVPLLDVADLLQRFADSPGQFLLDYGLVGLYGITVWLLTAPLLALAVYGLTRPLLSRAEQGLSASAVSGPKEDPE